MTLSSLLKLPTNTVRSDVSVTAKTLWTVPVGKSEFAVVRVLGDEPLDIVGFTQNITFAGRVNSLEWTAKHIGKRTFVPQFHTNLRFVLPESSVNMEIQIEP